MKNMQNGPLKLKITFEFLYKKIQEEINSVSNPMQKWQFEQMLQILKNEPKLIEGFDSEEELEKYQPAVNNLMSFLFPETLTDNEIKAAFTPLSGCPFYTTRRLQKIIDSVGDTVSDEMEKIFSASKTSVNYLLYSGILNLYYNFPVSFAKPMYLHTPKTETEDRKTYRISINADFLDVIPNETAIEITDKIFGELLENSDNVEVWNKYFPKDSWTIKGFGIFSLHDVTQDEQINDLKTHLIQTGSEVTFNDIINDIRLIFGIKDLLIGAFNLENQNYLKGGVAPVSSITLEDSDTILIQDFINPEISKKLFEEHEPIIISNFEKFSQGQKRNTVINNIESNGVKSLALIPIAVDEKLNFILEIASKDKNIINPISYIKFGEIIPYIESYAARTLKELEDKISAVIQRECTSIHPAVEWKFRAEAQRFIKYTNAGGSPTFDEITFKNVYPLYGQIDIVNSSASRNVAIFDDLKLQISTSKIILEKLLEEKKMPIYENLIYQVCLLENKLDEHFNSNIEQEINNFFVRQIYPVFQHNAQDEDAKAYLDALDPNFHSIYQSRKNYDQTVELVNKELSMFLDAQQEKAQKMFPHYFEKYKTDGIEHNLYIGQSLVEKEVFHPAYLHNLRLWQLQVICEMEALYYEKRKDFPMQLDVASLIFTFDSPINIRYRIDEKKFDVDGAYNVRYEIIKKRIDKALIKNTNERLTQAHKLSVVYSSPAIEKEYLQYFEFLQSKNYICKNIEIVELEDLQGASGLKAIRAEMNAGLAASKKNFTLNDMGSFVEFEEPLEKV